MIQVQIGNVLKSHLRSKSLAHPLTSYIKLCADRIGIKSSPSRAG